jgi:hypothetical protein
MQLNLAYGTIITDCNTIQLVSSPTGNRTQSKRLEGACAIHYTIGLMVVTKVTLIVLIIPLV